MRKSMHVKFSNTESGFRAVGYKVGKIYLKSPEILSMAARLGV